ncbi:MAG: hypothetical protein JW819_05105 [Candidatus Krumholzibacteriota bacterium]|nr:hypothetical protein [Candidatus Krumholzibacteriota bacterium]
MAPFNRKPKADAHALAAIMASHLQDFFESTLTADGPSDAFFALLSLLSGYEEQARLWILREKWILDSLLLSYGFMRAAEEARIPRSYGEDCY